MRERPESVESPGTYVTERVLRPCVLSDRTLMLWWLPHGKGRGAVT